jgi:hypothetical protein
VLKCGIDGVEDIEEMGRGCVYAPTERSTCRTQVLATIAMLERRHDRDVFRLDEIIGHMVERGTLYTMSTIRATILSSMCVDARAGSRAVYADLERVRRGHYRLIRRGI